MCAVLLVVPAVGVDQERAREHAKPGEKLRREFHRMFKIASLDETQPVRSVVVFDDGQQRIANRL